MDVAKADLTRTLGRLARGLSTLFWCLPLALVAQTETGRTDWARFLGPFAFLPALVLTAMLWFGLRRLRDFQKQERVWQQAVDRAELLAIINTGLSPFLFWWHRFPLIPFYIICVDFLALSAVLLLMQINRVLLRLSAMLPNEMLRQEARTFASLNIWMLLILLGGFGVDRLLRLWRAPVRFLGHFSFALQETALWFALFFALMPLAMTLALLWKIKEAIFSSLFESDQ
jgi:hypothetical protein